jgi:hypothetical protein
MIPKYTQQEFSTAKTSDKLACECEHCHNVFYTKKTYIQRVLSGNEQTQVRFCSRKCMGESMIKIISIQCEQCKKLFHRPPSQITKREHQFCSSKCYRDFQKENRTHVCLNCGITFERHTINNNTFCSRSCSSKYNADPDQFKKFGRKVIRSRFEYFTEDNLSKLYPDIEIHYNRTDTINSELDIYIPSLKLAFELNGILHYEPIFGVDRLSQIKNNDQRKFQACLEHNIELAIINTGNGTINKNKEKLYLSMITNIIDNKLKQTM